MATDPQDLYSEIRRRCPVLDRASFNELHAKYKAGDLAARDRLMYSNIGLVLKIATRYANRGVALDVLVQIGLIALMERALPKYEPERGLQFSTYATWWIRQRCKQEVMNTSSIRPYRVPIHALETRSNLRRIENALVQELGRTVDDEEVRAEFERRKEGKNQSESRDSFWHWAFQRERVFSMDASLNVDSSTTWHEFLSDDEDAIRNPETLAVLGEMRRRVQGALDRLDSRARAMLISHYGLGVPPRTLQEVGALHGVTRERTRQIEVTALARIGRILWIPKGEVAELLKGLSSSWPIREDSQIESFISPDIEETSLLNAFATLCEHAFDRLGDGHIRVKAPERTLHARLYLVPEESQAFLRAMQSKGWLRLDVRLDEAEILRLDYVPPSL